MRRHTDFAKGMMLRNFLRSRSRHNQYIPATRRRRHFLRHARIAMGIMQIA
jgi:hypothetical protein